MVKLISASLKVTIIGLVLAALPSVAQAPLDIRIALVIGNAAYQHVQPLDNSSNDARSMSLVLKRLGFTVIELVDGDKEAMDKSVEEMHSLIKGKQALAMLYYAGHGLQLNWRNFMVPVDAKLSAADDVPNQTVDVETVIKGFKDAQTRMNVIVLDACRDNPFSETNGVKGLAPLDAPSGTYIAFATAPGNVAEDGDKDSGNGLFTQYLLKELQRPSSIEGMFKRVRLQVRKKSDGRQVPWDSSSLEEDFSFNDGRRYTISEEDYEREIQLAKERNERLEREAEEAKRREDELKKQREEAALQLARTEEVKDETKRLKAEEQAKEVEKKIVLALDEERRKQLTLREAIELSRLEELQRIKDIALAKEQVEKEEQRKKLALQTAREQQFAEEKSDWDRIKDSKKADDFYAFLLKYPTGLIAPQANFALERLDQAQITVQENRDGVTPRVFLKNFRVGDQWKDIWYDGWKKTETRRSTGEVKRIEGDKVFAIIDNDNAKEWIFNQQGGVEQAVWAKGFPVIYDPPLLFHPGEALSVGKRWSNAFTYRNLGNQKTGFVSEEVKVLSYEDITVPAGTFKAYKVRFQGSDGPRRYVTDIWEVPDIPLPIRFEKRVYWDGKLVEWFYLEKESYFRGVEVAVK